MHQYFVNFAKHGPNQSIASNVSIHHLNIVKWIWISMDFLALFLFDWIVFIFNRIFDFSEVLRRLLMLRKIIIYLNILLFFVFLDYNFFLHQKNCEIIVRTWIELQLWIIKKLLCAWTSSIKKKSFLTRFSCILKTVWINSRRNICKR